MIKRYLPSLIILLFLSSCLKKGNDTIILPETNNSKLPEQMTSDWNVAIKCTEQEAVAIEAVMETDNISQNFSASGSGQDYDGDPINMTINGFYDSEHNTINAEVRYDFVYSGNYRIDHFAVDLDYYENGSYINMIKIEVSNPGGPAPSCESQIKLFHE